MSEIEDPVQGSLWGEDDGVVDEVDAEDEVPAFRYSITSYGADYPVDGLVQRMNSGDVYIPSFQRAYVWSLAEASRFVESLLLGLPVPGIFLAKEEASNRLLVIDGQQRLKTLQYFYGGTFEPAGRPFALAGVDRRFEHRTFDQLEEEDRRHLNDSIIHATVVRQDVPSDDDSSVYHVFERLNNGGKQLYPQEIRAALYHGAFNDALAEMNMNPAWRQVFGKESKRLRDQELILRFLALRAEATSYQKPLKDFLNRFMRKHRDDASEAISAMAETWTQAIEATVEALGSNAFKPQGALNSAVMDAFLVVVSEAQGGRRLAAEEIREAYEKLRKSKDFQVATTRHTSDEEVIASRLRLAREALAVSQEL